MRNKCVWLIGASEGIGAALAVQLSADGAQLVLSARNADRLQDVLKTLTGSGHRTLPMDVCVAEDVARVWQTLAASPPDVVICNAGAYTPMDAQHLDLAAVETMLDVNLRGAFRVVAAVLPNYLQQGMGHLVLVGSVAGYRGLPSAIGYGASKAGVMHLAENLKADLKGTGIKVQLVSPGFVKTRLTDKNQFRMPCMISAENAAQHIARGMKSDAFEIHFPKRFTLILKALRLLPSWLYFRLV